MGGSITTRHVFQPRLTIATTLPSSDTEPSRLACMHPIYSLWFLSYFFYFLIVVGLPTIYSWLKWYNNATPSSTALRTIMHHYKLRTALSLSLSLEKHVKSVLGPWKVGIFLTGIGNNSVSAQLFAHPHLLFLTSRTPNQRILVRKQFPHAARCAPHPRVPSSFG